MIPIRRALLAVTVATVTTTALAADPAPITPDEADKVVSAIKSAKPGDIVTLPAATWTDADITVSAHGTEDKPIILRAARRGQTVFRGASRIVLAGRHIVLDGVTFTGETSTKSPPVRFAPDSAHCRLTNASIVDFAAPFDTRFHYVLVGGTGHRVDHCEFAGKTNMNPMLAADGSNGGGTRVRVDHNHFRDFPHNPRNGREVIQILGVGSNDEPLSAGGCYWTVEHNLFTRAHGEGAEIISVKSNHNVVRHNTVRATKGAFTMRSGGGNTFESNVILGENEPGAGALRVSGHGGGAVNNYVQSVTTAAIKLHAGEYIEKDISGAYEPLLRKGAPLGRVAHYLPLVDGVVSNNLVVDTQGAPDLEYGSGYGNSWPAHQLVVLPSNLTFTNNIFATRNGPAGRSLSLRLPDDKSAKLPPEAQPRPMKASNNYLSGFGPVPETIPAEFAFVAAKVDLAESNGLLLPTPDSAAAKSGFDLTPFQSMRPLTPADVGPGSEKPAGN